MLKRGEMRSHGKPETLTSWTSDFPTFDIFVFSPFPRHYKRCSEAKSAGCSPGAVAAAAKAAVAATITTSSPGPSNTVHSSPASEDSSSSGGGGVSGGSGLADNDLNDSPKGATTTSNTNIQEPSSTTAMKVDGRSQHQRRESPDVPSSTGAAGDTSAGGAKKSALLSSVHQWIVSSVVPNGEERKEAGLTSVCAAMLGVEAARASAVASWQEFVQVQQRGVWQVQKELAVMQRVGS